MPNAHHFPPPPLLTMDDDSSSDSEEEPVEEPVPPPGSPLLIMDDDSSSDSEEEPVPPPAHSCYTIYIPTFLDDTLLSNMLITDLNAELLKKNWLTPDLVREIESCFPSKEEISNTAEGDNIRDLVAFKVKAAKLLPKGGIFVSFKQLDQVSKMFLDAWAINKVHVTKPIGCFYGQPCNKKSRRHEDPAKPKKSKHLPRRCTNAPSRQGIVSATSVKTRKAKSPMYSIGSRLLE